MGGGEVFSEQIACSLFMVEMTVVNFLRDKRFGMVVIDQRRLEGNT